MSREFNSEDSVGFTKEKPSHRVLLKTKFGTLTISLFTHNSDKSENNAFQKQLVEDLGVGTDMRNFILNNVESAIIEVASDKTKVKPSGVNFADLNK